MKRKTKDTKLIKLILWLLIVLIIIIGFIGIYTKKLNKLSNIIPEYTLGMDIKGNREIKLSVDYTEKDESVYVDENGNVAGKASNQDEPEQVDGYSIETRTIKANQEENLSISNYEKTKKIIQKRANYLGINEYLVKLNKESGDITLEMPQNTKTDDNYSILTSEGKFEVLDYQTGIVLMNNNDIVETMATTNQSTSGGYDVYLQIEFSKSGAEKLKEISKKYVEYQPEGEEETKIDYITMKLDETTLYTTYFNEEWTSNYIYIPIARGITDEANLKESYNSVNNIANIINSGKLPVKYTLASDNFIKSPITENNIKIFKYSVLGALVFVTILFAIKFKLKGLQLGLANIGFVALYSIILRYLNVSITLPGIVTILSVIILNIAFYYILLNKKIEEFNKEFIRFNIVIIPIIIISIVFTLSKDINPLSIGMVMFWGIISKEIYNYLLVKNILKK
ncbi:MAG: hypothetical protein ACI4UE_06725 [Candidatus Scatovivens sp.]